MIQFWGNDWWQMPKSRKCDDYCIFLYEMSPVCLKNHIFIINYHDKLYLFYKEILLEEQAIVNIVLSPWQPRVQICRSISAGCNLTVYLINVHLICITMSNPTILLSKDLN